MSTLRRMLVLLLLPVFCSGCACTREHSFTYNLWHDRKTASAPAIEPRLAVIPDSTRNDFLVCYDEQSGRSGGVTRRSYYLRAYDPAGGRRVRPPFVFTTDVTAAPLPVNKSAATAPSVTASNWSFTIHTDVGDVGPNHLPVYGGGSSAATKVALTPLAAVGDVTVLTFIMAVHWALDPVGWIH